ncbi:putative transmembrane protein [Liberibacter crescens BT-1]|uniref:Putative transmembrane protein n=1 Tax=Liberibacter crescens (strain BT-1) TaxID=1215343 RepID=L0EUW3_LIBCB|nr:heme biosynthesis HemY N-terminal domain-containing protein [Liberibacter crescens]AGA64752.1 putative transmembrane protein [Liberibacter crescens BT-1]
MLRIFRLLFFSMMLFFMAYGFIWLASIPGEISIIWHNHLYQIRPVIITSIFIATLLILGIIFSSVKFFLYSPFLITRFFRKHKNTKGYQALYTGLIALEAENKILACKMAYKASQLLNAEKEPMVYFLESQADIIQQKYTEAHKKFELMLKIPMMKELALRKLYVESCRINNKTSAILYAKEAADSCPSLPWSMEAILQDYCDKKQWSHVIDLLEKQKTAQAIDAREANSRKAVALTAKAMERLAVNDTLSSYNHAMEALRLDKGSIMASLVAAQAMILREKNSKAEDILEKIWAINPHPEVASLYISIHTGKDPDIRLSKAKKLENIHKGHVESLITTARAALEAGQFETAVIKATAAMKTSSRKSIYLLLASIEKARSGHLDQIHHWTQKALDGIPDPIWIAEDGSLSKEWLPLSPVTGKLCIFQWKMPVEDSQELLQLRNIVTEKTKIFSENLPFIPKYGFTPGEYNRKVDHSLPNFSSYQPDDPGVDSHEAIKQAGNVIEDNVKRFTRFL